MLERVWGQRVEVTSSMGGQIGRRKRKENPPKPDLSRTIVRQSRRRRNVRYSNFIEYDDFIEDDFEVKEEGVDREELRRGRKVKLVVKLSQQRARGHHANESRDSGSRREEEDGQDAGAAVAEDGEEERERRMVMKRRMSGREMRMTWKTEWRVITTAAAKRYVAE